MAAPAEHCVWLPFPPSANNLFAHASMFSKKLKRPVVRRFPTPAYKAYRKQALDLLADANLPLFTEPVIVKIELTPRDCRARDADNYAKAILDALALAGVIADDSNSHVKCVICYWEKPSTKPGALVMVRLAKDVGRPTLNALEREMLARIKREGVLLVGPKHRQTIAQTVLIEKGWVRTLPGLFDGIPQGYAPAEE